MNLNRKCACRTNMREMSCLREAVFSAILKFLKNRTQRARAGPGSESAAYLSVPVCVRHAGGGGHGGDVRFLWARVPLTRDGRASRERPWLAGLNEAAITAAAASRFRAFTRPITVSARHGVLGAVDRESVAGPEISPREVLEYVKRAADKSITTNRWLSSVSSIADWFLEVCVLSFVIMQKRGWREVNSSVSSD